MSLNNDGRKRLLDAFEEIGGKRSRSSLEEKPLHGVVICLTGLNSDKKNNLHALVEKLGGSYTRDFNLDKNTHLVAEVPQGAKYELAASHPRIQIVAPTWLEDCDRTGARVDEATHRVLGSETAIKPTYRQVLDVLLKDENVDLSLFEFQQFYMLGFEDPLEVKLQLGKAIRRGGGTIHWELSDDVTMLIVHDTCHDALRSPWRTFSKAAEVISSLHPNLPPPVSPRWVIESLRRNSLAPTAKYPPMRAQSSSAQKAATKPTKSGLARSNSTATPVFRGSLFALSRIPPATGAVDFDSKDQESLIKRHGGQILTLKLMDAMRTDAKNGGQRRRCHVVCWGGAPRLDLNPILSQLQRYNICDLTLVTPVWLKTCIDAQKLVLPSRLPEILIPQPWPFKDLRNLKLVVSITGFTPTEKAALEHVMKVCGIAFVNEMTNLNTHLICKEKATGLKLEKALEWGVHIVSVKWIYYILQHGYHGENDSSKGGYEDQFSLKSAEGGAERN